MRGANSHGGVYALAGARRFEDMADLIPPDNPPFVVMLDGIEDPYNFGFAVRVLYAAGADGLVLRERNWTSASAIVGRSSAGTSELMPIALAESALEAASFFRQRGLAVTTAAKSSASVSLFEAELRQPVLSYSGASAVASRAHFCGERVCCWKSPTDALSGSPWAL